MHFLNNFVFWYIHKISQVKYREFFRYSRVSETFTTFISQCSYYRIEENTVCNKVVTEELLDSLLASYHFNKSIQTNSNISFVWWYVQLALVQGSL